MPQSGMENSTDGTTDDNRIMRVSGDQKQQNVRFSDQIDPYLYSVESVIDPTRKLQDANDATLQNFFSRPIKIATHEWGVNSNLSFDINPWSLYFGNPRVTNRLSNFNLMRAKLHVKVVINGNGFQYGRAMVSYLPFDIYDTLSSNSALIRQDLVQASQQPRIFLDPTTSQGGELVLPFFNYLNYCSIPFSQWSALGQLYFRSLNFLKHANGASDLVTISVFAWAEDVEMSVLTSAECDDILPQSGKEVDEVNRDGIVSGPATSIAKVASTLTKVPYIAPFAHATEMAANTTASIAKMFGYCRPPVTKNPEPYKPHPASSLAITNTGDGPSKISVDAKQELSIDPRITGLNGVDSLNIREIAKRESYLTTFSWNIGTAPETLLWNARVDPCIWAQNTGPPVTYHFPACAMAALPFKYWTGTMKFRFQIVCSAFHKGRLKVVYDPNYFKSNEYNTNYLTIIDIADKTDFTVEIANGQPLTLLEHVKPGKESITTMYSNTPYTTPPSYPRSNGVVGVFVVNELTTPNSTVTNDIEINVFVSMGDDFEVFVPDDHFQYFTCKPAIQPQSGYESKLVSESQNTQEPSAPQQEYAEELGPTMSDNSDINKVFTGECITSFRTMLKRYNLWNSLGLTAAGAKTKFGRLSMYPYLRGNVAAAVDTDSLNNPYNYCNTILLHWCTWAFSGWRGSIRWKFLPRGPQEPSHKATMYIQRHSMGGAEPAFKRITPGSYANVTDETVSRSIVIEDNFTGFPKERVPFTGAKGQMYQSGLINSAFEFEMPYYSPYRFTPGKEEDHTSVANWKEGFDYFIDGRGQTYTYWDIHISAGEDFQLFFFTGLPRLYYESSPPA